MWISSSPAWPEKTAAAAVTTLRWRPPDLTAIGGGRGGGERGVADEAAVGRRRTEAEWMAATTEEQATGMKKPAAANVEEQATVTAGITRRGAVVGEAVDRRRGAAPFAAGVPWVTAAAAAAVVGVTEPRLRTLRNRTIEDMMVVVTTVVGIPVSRSLAAAAAAAAAESPVTNADEAEVLPPTVTEDATAGTVVMAACIQQAMAVACILAMAAWTIAAEAMRH